MTTDVSHRIVTWGEGLLVETFKAPGGLKAIVQAIAAELGPNVGSRPTFTKLLRVEDPALLSERDRWRAWLVLSTIGLDPADWGISDQVVPPALNAKALRDRLIVRHQGLEPRTR